MIQTIIFAALILYLTIFNLIEKERAHKREKDLLNRLAAKDLQDYTIAVERRKKGQPERVSINELLKEGEDILPVT